MPSPFRITRYKAPDKRDKVRRFFIDNPDEELLLSDIMTKFGMCEGTVRSTIHQLRREGLIESVHVYRAIRKNR